MGILKEAGYVYLLSRGLVKSNKRLRKLGKLAEKHKEKHGKASEHKKEKYRRKHSSVIKEINELMTKHNRNLSRIKVHYHRFAHYLRKEHKL